MLSQHATPREWNQKAKKKIGPFLLSFRFFPWKTATFSPNGHCTFWKEKSNESKYLTNFTKIDKWQYICALFDRNAIGWCEDCCISNSSNSHCLIVLCWLLIYDSIHCECVCESEPHWYLMGVSNISAPSVSVTVHVRSIDCPFVILNRDTISYIICLWTRVAIISGITFGARAKKRKKKYETKISEILIRFKRWQPITTTVCVWHIEIESNNCYKCKNSFYIDIELKWDKKTAQNWK